MTRWRLHFCTEMGTDFSIDIECDGEYDTVFDDIGTNMAANWNGIRFRYPEELT